MLYGFISIIWSEIPFVAFKRFFKTIGNPIMALVVLSEAEPLEALKTVFRRCAYMLLLFSIATIKYFPHIGRQYHVTGDVMFRGVTGQKNELGLICMILGTAFLLGILRNNAGKNPLAEKKERYVYILLACISAYLLIKSNSATSLLCFIVGIFVMITTRYKMFQNYPKRLNNFALGSVVVVLILEYAFDVKSVVIASLGRDSSLTTRVPMWEFYRNIASNPIVGAGFESFWTYDRMELARAEFGSNFSVHSGYLDLYLNLGIIGVCLFGITIVAIYRNINQDLAANRLDFAIYRLIFMTIILLYSYTEAYFVGVNMFYFMYYFVLMKCPVPGENVKYANNLSRSRHGAAVPQE
jgi:O-antigen ligase